MVLPRIIRSWLVSSEEDAWVVGAKGQWCDRNSRADDKLKAKFVRWISDAIDPKPKTGGALDRQEKAKAEVVIPLLGEVGSEVIVMHKVLPLILLFSCCLIDAYAFAV